MHEIGNCLLPRLNSHDNIYICTFYLYLTKINKKKKKTIFIQFNSFVFNDLCTTFSSAIFIASLKQFEPYVLAGREDKHNIDIYYIFFYFLRVGVPLNKGTLGVVGCA